MEIVYPEFAVWENPAAGFVYPYIFTSDSDWSVDLCAQVPEGYNIVGVYDENGDLIADANCHQTFVTGETRVVAFEVIEVGSPDPVLAACLDVFGGHSGTTATIDTEVPGTRMYPDSGPMKPFVRDDVNADGAHDISDAVASLGWLFRNNSPRPTCLDAADANDDGKVDLADPVFSLACQFRGDRCSPSPVGECGLDPTMDDLTCESFSPCE